MSRADLERHDLSRRALQRLTQPSPALYLDEHFERLAQLYHPASRPDGYIPLCVAENRLVWDLLAPVVRAPRDVPAEAMDYDVMIGSLGFREALSELLATRVLKRRFDPENIAVLAGAGSVLEILFWALADPGDGVLVPTPSYAGFWLDLEGRDDLRIAPVHTRLEDGFRLTPELLDRALATSERPIRALLFTSPNNPLGAVYGRDDLEPIVCWAEERGVHLVFDEIYALSVFGDRPFVSVAELRPELGDRIHIVWGFSKDFAAGGLRCGVLVSENRGVLDTVSSLAYWACCSGDTQVLLREIITDAELMRHYVSEMPRRLGASYRRVASVLEEHHIPFVPSEAGLFLIVDARRFLDEPSWEAEDRLWRRLLDEVNVNLTPGASLRAAQPGLFRLCFASVEPAVAELGVRRVAAVLGASGAG